MQEIYRGDIYSAPVPYSSQDGSKIRPIIIVSNDIHNAMSSEVIGVAVSSSDRRPDLPANVANLRSEALKPHSTAKCTDFVRLKSPC